MACGNGEFGNGRCPKVAFVGVGVVGDCAMLSSVFASIITGVLTGRNAAAMIRCVDVWLGAPLWVGVCSSTAAKPLRGVARLCTARFFLLFKRLRVLDGGVCDGGSEGGLLRQTKGGGGPSRGGGLREEKKEEG